MPLLGAKPISGSLADLAELLPPSLAKSSETP